jgi:hypothetical protein
MIRRAGAVNPIVTTEMLEAINGLSRDGWDDNMIGG